MFFKKYKYYILIAIILIVAVVFYRRYKAKKALAELTQVDASQAIKQPGATKPSPGDSFPLQKGSKGNNVIYLQRALNLISPGWTIDQDGDFGTETYNKLITSIGTKYYPVTSEMFTEIINRSINK